MSDNITIAKPRNRRGRPPGSKNKPRERKPTPRLGYRINEFVEATGMSRSTAVRLIGDGTIRTAMIGHMRIIPHDEVARLLKPARLAAVQVAR